MKTLFNDNWKFQKFALDTPYEHMIKDVGKLVDIPHDWQIWDTKDLYEDSVGLYTKTFIYEEKDNLCFLRFDGVYMDASVYLNQQKIFEWKYGYSTFEVDLTPYLIKGANILHVVVPYRSPNSRWYSGAGIYRNVYLISKKETYFTSDGLYLSSQKTDSDFELLIDTSISSTKPNSVNIRHTLIDTTGREVTTVMSSSDTSEGVTAIHQSMTVHSPICWDITNPYLYSVRSELYVDDVLYDSMITKYGFRTIRFDPDKGFFLNDKNVKINGVCQHHDLGALGAAINVVAMRRQFDKLIKMGVNSIRTSHNMPAPEILDLADEMGLLIYDESFDMWERPKTTYDYANYFKEWWLKDVISWVCRDRNHPSVIIWGIGNEIYDTHAGTGLEWTIKLRDAVYQYDYNKNAIVGIGSNYIEWENAQKCADQLELSGYNYSERLYDEHHKKYPHWCIFGSETSSTVQSRGIYHFPLNVRLLTYEDEQCSCLGNCTTNWGAPNVDTVVANHRDRDYIFGQYIWSGWDYIGEPTPYFSKNSFFGQIDTAGFEKDTYYHYQAEWTDYRTAPMIHLLPYWDFNEGQLIDVCAYTNAPSLELFLNDISCGRQTIDHKNGKVLAGNWQLAYTKGVLKAVAYDENNNIIATDIQESFSDPATICLNSDKSIMNADGNDLIFIEISTKDRNGHYVANARNRMNVNVHGAGRLVGLDNGDSTDYEQYKGSSRRLFSGKLLAIIASQKNAGEIRVSVTSEGLEPAELRLTSIEAPIIEGSATMTDGNYLSELTNEIPVRKIELVNTGTSHLDSEHRTTLVKYSLYPENATYHNVTFRALTLDAVDANCVSIEMTPDGAFVTALGDGIFRLSCFCNNDKQHPEIVSELEFDVTGMGTATHDPYKLVPGCQCDECSHDSKLSFQGGIHVITQDYAYISFHNVDFGDYGSDEISIPVFIFEEEMPIEIWEGDVNTGECLLRSIYKAKFWYNHYQENIFKLSRRLKGTTTLTIAFQSPGKVSIQGFTFTRFEKAYGTVLATENNRITGDRFTVGSEAITDIGNNVSIEFENMDFSERGISAVEICGKSNIDKNTIHILFFDGDNVTKQIIEVKQSADYCTSIYPLESVSCKCKVSFVFLPGSDFDFKHFTFLPK